MTKGINSYSSSRFFLVQRYQQREFLLVQKRTESRTNVSTKKNEDCMQKKYIMFERTERNKVITKQGISKNSTESWSRLSRNEVEI